MSGSTASTAEVIERFNQVFQQRDPSGLAALVGADCVMEGLSPAPGGTWVEGAEECIRFWSDFATDPANDFEVEDVVCAQELSVIRWKLVFGPGEKDYVRCVNVMRVRDGLIIEALGYAKTG
ncbi:nuclear transport factor 2 family protein [Streptomyces sp. NBC_01006]|uniref:nuclear transport factor 2 family protein n=1 Tax=Streptomyces sp. NBC_01006 TaxID=2903716 RepID=UPI00386FDF3F|nr:nuclear transport factor 2 family protein [Streptomyces sp. NBC_01006]